MQTIFDYLEWRGDLSFARDRFNEVDNLILSVLAYSEFDGIVDPQESGRDSISLLKAAEQFGAKMDRPSSVDHNRFFKQIPNFLSKAAQTTRFGEIQLSSYENQVNFEQSKQFSAVVFSLNSEQHFIAFRGTDDTLIGWQEDLLMSFMEEVPAQKQAVIYMNRIFSNLAGNFYLGGHSKGGNVAVYAATHATETNQKRITGIYNNDGPGFRANILKNEGYQNILNKISTIIPKSSIVGMLLEHKGEYKVVGSSEPGIMQHNPFTWELRVLTLFMRRG